MSKCRRFREAPVMRLIVSVPADDVGRMDELLSVRRHLARGCRAELVRLAIAEKLARDSAICARPKGLTAMHPSRYPVGRLVRT